MRTAGTSPSGGQPGFNVPGEAFECGGAALLGACVVLVHRRDAPQPRHARGLDDNDGGVIRGDRLLCEHGSSTNADAARVALQAIAVSADTSAAAGAPLFLRYRAVVDLT